MFEKNGLLNIRLIMNVTMNVDINFTVNVNVHRNSIIAKRKMSKLNSNN